MSGRGAIPCKFGVQCHRQDCYFQHPDGRIMDASASGVGGPPRNDASRGMPLQIGGGMMPAGMPMQPSPRTSAGNGLALGGRECRYGFECKRRDCHFSHPYGRAIDGEGGGASGAGPSLSRNASATSSVGSLSRGLSEVSFGSYPPANATDNDQDLKDTWFPKARDCTCCKGYVYGCTSEICESMGQCTCSIDEKDLDGSSAVSSSTARSSTGESQGDNGVNGMPPQPPTEAALAAATSGSSAGSSSRPSPRGSGGRGNTDCRYGAACKRADCFFNHPQGRNMEADGVSFGDFASGEGGKKAGGKGQAQLDQDLMDTWFPDCRECACCKGYKHGCTTPACKAAGLCACSRGDGTVAPIAAAANTPAQKATSATDGRPADDGEKQAQAEFSGDGKGVPAEKAPETAGEKVEANSDAANGT